MREKRTQEKGKCSNENTEHKCMDLKRGSIRFGGRLFVQEKTEGNL